MYVYIYIYRSVSSFLTKIPIASYKSSWIEKLTLRIEMIFSL